MTPQASKAVLQIAVEYLTKPDTFWSLGLTAKEQVALLMLALRRREELELSKTSIANILRKLATPPYPDFMTAADWEFCNEMTRDPVHLPWGITGYGVHDTPSGFKGACGSEEGSVILEPDFERLTCLACISLTYRPAIAAKYLKDFDSFEFKSDELRDEFFGIVPKVKPS